MAIREDEERRQTSKRLLVDGNSGDSAEDVGDIDKLPDDLLNYILRLFSTGAGNAALRCAEVCQRWERESRSAILVLHLRNARPRHFVERVPKYVTLTQLTLVDCHVGQRGWYLLAACCRQLSLIHLQKVVPPLSSLDATLLLYGRTNLAHLRIVESLHSPDVRCLGTLTSLLSLDLTDSHHLLSLPSLQPLTSLTTLSLKNCWSLLSAPGLETLTQLHTLNLTKCYSLVSTATWPQPLLFRHLSLVRSLSISSPNMGRPVPPGLRFPHIVPRIDPPSPPPFPPLPSLQHFTFSDSPNATHLPRLTNTNSSTSNSSLLSATVSKCSSLMCIAALSDVRTLQEVKINYCSALTSITPLANLSLLHKLTFVDCRSVTDLQPLQSLSNLQELALIECTIQDLTFASTLSNLASLDFSKSLLPSAPAFPEALRNNLRSLSLSGCTGLTDARSLTILTALRSLDLSNCRSLSLLHPLHSSTNLDELQLTGRMSPDIIASLGALPSLRTLEIHDSDNQTDARNTDFVLALPTTVQSLKLSLPDAPHSLSPLPALANLTLQSMRGTDCLHSLRDAAESFTSLHSLTITKCYSLTNASALEALPMLRSLQFVLCKSLMTLPNLAALPRLEDILLRLCYAIVEIPPTRALPCLASLNLFGCVGLKRVNAIESLPRLHSLRLQHCVSLTDIAALNDLPALRTLDLRHSLSLRRLPDLGSLPELHKLNLRSCELLREIPSLAGLPSLEEIDARGCSALRCLPRLDGLPWLREVNLEVGTRLPQTVPSNCVISRQNSREQ